ncbi:ABC transporter ATP-binding protein [soil metagenome]
MDILLQGLGYHYPGGADGEAVLALDRVDLAITAGQGVALVGANGSGKTTLLMHLDGLLRPTRGRVLIGGEDAAGLRVARLAARVGLCFADPDRQLFKSSVRGEVEFGPRQLGHSPGRRRRAVEAALAATDLSDAAERNPFDLGLSRRRLVALASVLAMETPIVALDEPTAGLDAADRARVQVVIAGLLSEGRTVIAASHDMRFVAESFARAVVLRAGQVTLDGDPAATFGKPSWELLAQAGLEPPEAAVVGARLGLGATPTDADLVAALQVKHHGRGSIRQGAGNPSAT